MTQYPIPNKSTWESHMLSFGQTYLDLMRSQAPNLRDTFYDAEKVYANLREYTNDPKWDEGMQLAEEGYRDGYVIPNNGNILGYWVFSAGLFKDWARNGDTISKDAVHKLAVNSAYAANGVPLTYLYPTSLCREVAYALRSHIDDERCGVAPRAQTTVLRNASKSHLDQWFLSRSDPAYYPFWAGLAFRSLIDAMEKYPDPQVVQIVKSSCDWLWANAWLPASQAFRYAYNDATPSPDLNLLIAPAFAWLYIVTGQAQYRTNGDAIWSGGVLGAWLGDQKHFNQNYLWSFDYVVWREAGI